MIVDGRVRTHLKSILLMDNPRDFGRVVGYLVGLSEETRLVLRTHPEHGPTVERLIDDGMFCSYTSNGNESE